MLTDKQARALKPGDKPVFDGKVTGLLLTPSQSGCKWTLRFTSPVTSKRRDAGLGTYPETSIAEAREKALATRKLIDSGEDPIDQRNREREAAAAAAAALTFEKAARQVHQDLERVGKARSMRRNGSAHSKPTCSQSSETANWMPSAPGIAQTYCALSG